SVWPKSASRTPYELPVAPTTSPQPSPVTSQRRHWKANERAPPVHVPREAVSSSPTTALPVIVGRPAFVGATFAEMTPVVWEFAEAWPSVFEAVTTTRTVWSMSFAWRVYVVNTALSMFVHPVPSVEHRCQR